MPDEEKVFLNFRENRVHRCLGHGDRKKVFLTCTMLLFSKLTKWLLSGFHCGTNPEHSSVFIYRFSPIDRFCILCYFVPENPVPTKLLKRLLGLFRSV